MPTPMVRNATARAGVSAYPVIRIKSEAVVQPANQGTLQLA